MPGALFRYLLFVVCCVLFDVRCVFVVVLIAVNKLFFADCCVSFVVCCLICDVCRALWFVCCVLVLVIGCGLLLVVR